MLLNMREFIGKKYILTNKGKIFKIIAWDNLGKIFFIEKGKQNFVFKDEVIATAIKRKHLKELLEAQKWKKEVLEND